MSLGVPAAPAGPLRVSTLAQLVGVLKRARLARGWSQRDVAEQLGMHPTAVHNWEAGLNWPRAGVLVAWCRLLGMPLWAIAEGEGLSVSRPAAHAHGGTDATVAHKIGSDTDFEREG